MLLVYSPILKTNLRKSLTENNINKFSWLQQSADRLLEVGGWR